MTVGKDSSRSIHPLRRTVVIAVAPKCLRMATMDASARRVDA